MKDLFGSKKFKTAIIGVIVAFAGHFLDIPAEVVERALWAILAAIGGFAAQDVGKERAKLEALTYKGDEPKA